MTTSLPDISEKTNLLNRVALLFTVKDSVGALEKALHIIKSHNISLTHIESRPSKHSSDSKYDFFVEFDGAEYDSNCIKALVESLKLITSSIQVVGTGETEKENEDITPWFPRKMSDLDTFAEKVLSYGADLDADHPGFKDPAYRARRAEITAIARTYKTGQPLPRINYTEAEVETWSAVFNHLTKAYKSHACKEHQYVFPLLVQNCGYRPDNIPQLEDVSRFLKDCTGWTLRPVMGLLSSRDFLNGLAFRVFHSTQYIRHSSKPLYTPEPDVCHELLGHVPLFADPEFAEFSQEIGLASLGVSDEDLKKLATIYWFTVEFGMCRQDGELKAYGAGILSSFGELEYSVSDKPEFRPFEVAKMAVQEYPITTYQPIYFVAESFKEATEKVREFASTLHRPFGVRYNPYTQSIEVLDKKEKLIKYVSSIKADIQNVLSALEKL